MINPYDKNINWNDRAKDEMSLLRMIDTYLIEGEYSIPHIKYKPSEPIQSGHFGLNAIYRKHDELLNKVVKIFFPTEKFTPSEINKEGTSEYFMFIVINAIHDIVWYNNIEESRPRGYEKFMKELDKARFFLYTIADCTTIDSSIQCPIHRNETIEGLSMFFENSKRKLQGEKIINEIKNYFGIEKITSTKYKKIIDANKRLHEKIKQDHDLTDEELHNIPIIGQLQTKI